MPVLTDFALTSDDALTLGSRLTQVREALVGARKKLVAEIDAQLAGLDELEARVSSVNQAPARQQMFQPPMSVESQPDAALVIEAPTAAASSVVIEADAAAVIDPKLEQETLAELNEALSKAFAQIATRPRW